MEATLFKMTGEKNRLSKSDYLTTIDTVDIYLLEDTSITNPIIKLKWAGVPDFNYIYINNFNRYYFVTDITSINNNIWEIGLHVDVLKTYADSITSCYGFIERSESRKNYDIIDTKRTVKQGYKSVNVQSFDVPDTDFFNYEGNNFILVGLDLRVVQ